MHERGKLPHYNRRQEYFSDEHAVQMQKFWIITEWGPNEERRGDVGEHLENHVAHLDFNPCIWILNQYQTLLSALRREMVVPLH